MCYKRCTRHSGRVTGVTGDSLVGVTDEARSHDAEGGGRVENSKI